VEQKWCLKVRKGKIVDGGEGAPSMKSKKGTE